MSAEQKARAILARRLSVSLDRRKLVVGYNHEGIPRLHEFDCVSENQSIVGEIKSYKITTIGAYETTQNARLLRDIFWLQNIKAETKFLALTNKGMYDRFASDFGSLLPPEIKLWYVRVR